MSDPSCVCGMNLVFQINCFYKPLIGLQLHHLIGISFASNGSHNLGFDCLRGIVIQFLLLGFEWLPMIWVRMPAKVNSSVETSCLSREGFVTIDSAEKMLLLLVALWPVSSLNSIYLHANQIWPQECTVIVVRKKYNNKSLLLLLRASLSTELSPLPQTLRRTICIQLLYIYIYILVCVYLYMYIYIYIAIGIDIYPKRWGRPYVYIYIYTSVYPCISMHSVWWNRVKCRRCQCSRASSIS